MTIRWWTLRMVTLHKKLTALQERKEELFSYVAYPKPLEMKMAVVQTSGSSGDEVLDYIVKTEEIDMEILEVADEMEGLTEYLNRFLYCLTDRERMVVVLRFYDFRSWPQIAKAVYGEISERNIDKARKVKKNALRKIDTEMAKKDRVEDLTEHPTL